MTPAAEVLEGLAPEARRQIYKLLRLGVRFRPDWPLEIIGSFAKVGGGSGERSVVLQTLAT